MSEWIPYFDRKIFKKKYKSKLKRSFLFSGGIEKRGDTSTSFVAPFLIVLSMTLYVTLSATKRSRCFSLRGNRLRLGARSRSFGVE